MQALIEFLKAAIHQDATMAEAARQDGDWWWNQPESPAEHHIARHAPARALREAEAKQAILAEHQPYGAGDPHRGRCRTCHGEIVMAVHWDGEKQSQKLTPVPLPWPCPTIQALLAVYAGDYDAYRQRWMTGLSGDVPQLDT